MDAVHLALTAGRPWDLVLDVAAGKGTAQEVAGAAPPRTTRRQPGRAGPGRAPGRSRSRWSTWSPRAGRAPSLRTPGRDLRDNPERDLAALAASTTDLRVRDGWLCATSAVDTLAKVPEADADALPASKTVGGSHADDDPRAALRLAMRPAVERPGRPAQRVRRPGGVAARVRRRDLPGPPGGVRRRLRAAGELSTPVQETAAQRGLRGVGSPVRPRARAGDERPRRAGVPARHLRPRPLRARADRPARPSLGLAHRPGQAPRPARAGVRQARARSSRAGSGSCSPPAASTPTRVVVAHEPTARRGCWWRRRRCSGCPPTCTPRSPRPTPRWVPAWRRARRPTQPGPAAAVLLPEARQAQLPQRRGGRGTVRGPRLRGGVPGGPPACRAGADGARRRRGRGLRRERDVPDRLRRRAEARDPGRLGVLHRQQRVPDLLGRRAPSRPRALPPGRAEEGPGFSNASYQSDFTYDDAPGGQRSSARSWPTCETAGNKRRRPSVAALRDPDATQTRISTVRRRACAASAARSCCR